MNLNTILTSLKDHKVNFIIIGATAGIAHGFERFTKDLDILFEPTKENTKRLFVALEACGYDLMDTTIEEALEKKLLFRQYIFKLDTHPDAKGITFENAWQNKIEYELAGQKVFFASLDDLIAMKKAAGRPQDLEDLRYLEEIKRQKEKKSNVLHNTQGKGEKS